MVSRKIYRLAAAVLIYAYGSVAHASASILGFSIGEENISLAAIAASVAQQVTILNDLVAISKTTKENIAFVKEVYATANEVANTRWQDVVDDMAREIENGVPELREIRRTTEDIIADKVPRSNRFRRLVGAGMGHALGEIVEPYVPGPAGERHALLDYSALSLASFADKRVTEMRLLDNQRRRTVANEECKGSIEDCTRATGRMSVESASTLRDILTLQAEKAKLDANEASMRNDERKREASGVQKDMLDLADSLSRAAEPDEGLPVYTADGVQ